MLDVASGTVTSLVSVRGSDRLPAIAFSPDGDRILFATTDTDALWSVRAGRIRRPASRDRDQLGRLAMAAGQFVMRPKGGSTGGPQHTTRTGIPSPERTLSIKKPTIAAAVVAAVAVAGLAALYAYAPGIDIGSGPMSSPTDPPIATPLPSATPGALPDAASLAPGIYVLSNPFSQAGTGRAGTGVTLVPSAARTTTPSASPCRRVGRLPTG